MRETTTCSECGATISVENAQYFDNHVFCEECYERYTTTCDNCGETIWRENAEGDSNYTLCAVCYDECFTNCERCGRLISNSDAYYEEGEDYPYCSDCIEKINNDSIKNYNYKPEPIFHGSGNLFLGVELEIDKGGERSENAQILLDIANEKAEHLYCKHDGSINDGFEIVSHPMTLDYHLNNMNWSEIFERAVNMGYRSYQTTTCGFHVHVNRNAFGKTYDEQEECITRIVYTVENFWNELVRFSRRTEISLNRWASRYGIMTTAKDTYKSAKDKRMGRYVAVNLENEYTIEFRMFRGTLFYPTFKATLQLVDELCNIAINHDDKYIESLSWSDFVQRIRPEKSELIEYLKEKMLYVNEPMIRTGDDN